MPRVQDNGFVTFNSGKLDLCKVKDRVIVETKHRGLRYGEQTVGVTRFWSAKVASSNIDKVVAILQIDGVSQMDMCIINSVQYKIKQIQEKHDTNPPCLFLSLEKNTISYKDARSEEQPEGGGEG